MTAPSGNVTRNVSALPFRAYTRIWNEYFRDQNVQEAIVIDDGSTTLNDVANCLNLRKKCWEKDYFTSALPWAQRGDAVKFLLGYQERI